MRVSLTIFFFFRVKPVRQGERRSRRKLGLAPEYKAEDLPVRTRRPRILVQAPEPVAVVQTPVSVPVEAMPAELPRDLQNPLVVSPVVRLVFSPTPAVNSADVDDEAMAAIGQRVVAEAPCVALEVVAEEQVFEARIPVVPIAPAPQRGLVWWYIGAALTVGNMIVNDRPVFF